ncbi:neuronal acetylcholine receptor subunit alpha-3-like [Glandiceps talaboti]
MNDKPLHSVAEKRDLGVLIQNSLETSHHCAAAAKEANRSLGVTCNDDEERLQNDLFKEYKRLVCPTPNSSTPLIVQFGVSLTHLLDVEWKDYRLTWNASDYGNKTSLVIPLKKLWYSDMALYKSADLQRQQYPKVTDPTITCRVFSNGVVVAVTPGIYKLPCVMNMEHFPFDKQYCTMKFGTWAYVNSELDVVLMNDHVTIENYIENREWTISNSTAWKDQEYYQEIDDAFPIAYFDIVLARKPTYYVINLIVPCLMLSVLTLVVFYLPPDCGEKISLSISILLAFHVFNLLVADIMPPTSSPIPMISRYLLFNMTLVVLSVIMTAFVLNIQRGPVSKRPVPRWVRTVFVRIAPKFLCMHPKRIKGDKPTMSSDKDEVDFEGLTSVLRRRKRDQDYKSYVKGKDTRPHGGKAIWLPRTKLAKETNPEDVPLKRFSGNSNNVNVPNLYAKDRSYESNAISANISQKKRSSNLRHTSRSNSSDFERHVSNCLQVILKSMEEKSADDAIKEEWKFVAIVFDRILLVFFSVVCLMGTIGILFSAPLDSLFPKGIDQNFPQ